MEPFEDAHDILDKRLIEYILTLDITIDEEGRVEINSHPEPSRGSFQTPLLSPRGEQ